MENTNSSEQQANVLQYAKRRYLNLCDMIAFYNGELETSAEEKINAVINYFRDFLHEKETAYFDINANSFSPWLYTENVFVPNNGRKELLSGICLTSNNKIALVTDKNVSEDDNGETIGEVVLTRPLAEHGVVVLDDVNASEFLDILRNVVPVIGKYDVYGNYPVADYIYGDETPEPQYSED